MRTMNGIIALSCITAGLALVGCARDLAVQCFEDDHCSRVGAGEGKCVRRPETERAWCAHAAPECPGSGFRYSTDVGDGLAGQCVVFEVDAGTNDMSDAQVDASPDAAQLDAGAPRCESIVFASNNGGAWDLWRIDVDGHNAANISKMGVSSISVVRASPRTNKVAFAGKIRNGSDVDILVVNGDGSGFVNVSDGAGDNNAPDSEPVWLPNGRSLLFTSSRDGNLELYSVNVDGSEIRRITNIGSSDFTPVPSPDGSRIAFISDRDGNRELYVMNGSGGGLVRLTQSADAEGFPQWSPDGKKISFTRGGDLWVMNTDGSGQANLTNTAATEHSARWSPDSTAIAFHTDRDGNGEIYTTTPAGTLTSNLTRDPHSDTLQDPWSPDGRAIVFSSDRAGDHDVWKMGAGGESPVRLTRTPSAEYFAVWLRCP